MTKTTTKMKKSISILMVVLTLMSIFAVFAVPASAATTSSGTQTRTITVTTKGNWLVPGSESITLSQNKGTCVEENYNFFTFTTLAGDISGTLPLTVIVTGITVLFFSLSLVLK